MSQEKPKESSTLIDLQAIAEAKKLFLQRVTWVHHWTDSLFSFRIERPDSFRFRSGEFVMIGLEDGNRPLLRAYSIVSPNWEEHLEFFSIKVPEGPLTSRLQHLKVGDYLFLNKKPTGTLVTDALKSGQRLFMIGTGTGLAPFLSVLRDPETHEKFDEIILTHTVREEQELAYREFLEEQIHADEIFGELLRDRFTYYPTVTRGEFRTQGRITDRIQLGDFAKDLGLIGNRFNPLTARVMVCGSMAFNKDMASMLKEHGLQEGSNSAPGSFVVERAFVG
ncbi:MAG: ferredoxin--NADP reductase [Woeseiaceae bacterium]|jgi:ferredoxin--NADP+ reductase|nr:ferredoxin--NADP reductase [Woeseiaceae bacterium]